jgi:threonine/homoserine/homoserine lactone efflux protein
VLFLVTVAGVSISGVISPGPVTATTITMGARNRHAGFFIALGHGLLELPLMVLIILGMDRLLSARIVQIVVGIAGSLVLLYMAAMMWRGAGRELRPAEPAKRFDNPVVAGFLLSAGNPFFLIWWATIGLGLAIQAKELGAIAFVLFTLTHIACDVVWLEIVSLAAFRGAKVLGKRVFAFVVRLCSAALVCFSGVFLWNSVRSITG